MSIVKLLSISSKLVTTTASTVGPQRLEEQRSWMTKNGKSSQDRISMHPWECNVKLQLKKQSVSYVTEQWQGSYANPLMIVKLLLCQSE